MDFGADTTFRADLEQAIEESGRDGPRIDYLRRMRPHGHCSVLGARPMRMRRNFVAVRDSNDLGISCTIDCPACGTRIQTVETLPLEPRD